MKNLLSVPLLIVVLLLSTHAFLGLRSMRSLSPTYDEHVHLTAGYSYFKTGDYRLNTLDHPPFSEMWAAIPLLFLNPAFPAQHPYWQQIWKYQYAFSDIFMYKNTVDPEKMLNSGRAMTLLLSLLLGLGIYFFAKEIFGGIASFIALFLWAFCPAFIANGTLVSTDMAITLFYFLSVYLFWRWYKEPEQKKNRLNSVLFGLSLALLCASKYSSVVIFPVIGLIALVYWLKGSLDTKKTLTLIAVSLACVLAVLCVIYQFNPLNIYYWAGLKKVLAGVASGRSSFFLGEHSTSGWYYYFPAVFLLKTPLALLVLLIASGFVKRLWTMENILFLLWPVLFYLGLSCYAKVNIGHRHILPIYPFLIVIASGLPYYIDKKIFKISLSFLLLWYGYSSMRIYPWYLCYFNELVGNADNGYKYVSDSNVDWGQGLKALGSYLKDNKISGIYLNYFGVGDPHYYGIKYVPIGFIDNISYPYAEGLRNGDRIDLTREPRTLFAISATNLDATYYADKNVFSWLKNIQPEKIIAHSILVYDMSMHPQEYEKLKAMLK